jgi:hypothetical protein
MSNMSVSNNNVYSTTIGGVNPLKSLFVTEGENLVNNTIIFILFYKNR